MRLRVFSALTFTWMFALVGFASAQKHCSKVNIDPTTGFCTVPDPALTHGLIDASQACVSNHDRPRKVTKAEKEASLASYDSPANTDTSTGEFDHWFPHWMEGSDKQANIQLLWRKVCRDKTMTLAQAKRIYLQGWTKLLPQHSFHESILLHAGETQRRTGS
jgi:hypothetical protein